MLTIREFRDSREAFLPSCDCPMCEMERAELSREIDDGISEDERNAAFEECWSSARSVDDLLNDTLFFAATHSEACPV